MRWKRYLRRSKWDEERARELSAHLEIEADENVSRGMLPDEAHYAANKKLGNATQIREEIYRMNSVGLLEVLWKDFRYALRMLRRSPGFAVVVVATLALGIGANTAIFSVVYAALLRPLPYANSQQLVVMGESRVSEDAAIFEASYPDFVDWVHSAKGFQSLAGFNAEGFTSTNSSGDAQLVHGAQVTTNFFSTLGVTPILGRGFVAGEDVPQTPKYAILSYGYWLNNCGGDAQIIGRAIQLNGKSITVVGVLPKQFEFAPVGSPEVWVPLHLSNAFATQRNIRWLHVVGRLATGVSLNQARVEMQGINRQLSAAYPQENGKIFFAMKSLRDQVVGAVRPLLVIVFGAVSLILLIACANVGNLLMVRATGRRREFAIRTALGAGRSDLIRQSLVESLLLATCGGALGFVLALWGTPLLIATIPVTQLDAMPYLRDVHSSFAVLSFLCGAVLLTGLLFGFAPALQISGIRVSDALKEESRGSHGVNRSRIRDTVVVAEIAFSLVLLVGAGLLVKSLGTLLHRDLGFTSESLVTFATYLPAATYADEASDVRFMNAFTNRIRSLPGVESADEVAKLPLAGPNGSVRFLKEGHPVAKGQEDECDISGDTPGYFSTMKIPLLRGRFFNDLDDTATKPAHVIVNQAFLKRFFADEDPIGKRIQFTLSPDEPFREIVGVVGSTSIALDGPWSPIVYQPYEQSPDPYFSYVVRTSGNPAEILNVIRGVLHEADPKLLFLRPMTMDQMITQSPSVFLRRFPSILIGGFAVLALILGSIGIYGLIAYSVSQRTREFGIRMAVGAEQRDILRLVLRHGAYLTLTGVAIGTVAGLGLTRVMASLLYGVSANDPLVFVAVALLLTFVALMACYIPARRATRVDPLIALRYE